MRTFCFVCLPDGQVIVTSSTSTGASLPRPKDGAEPPTVNTEERFLAAIDGPDLVLDRPLAKVRRKRWAW